MTRTEAVDILNNAIVCIFNNDESLYSQAMRIAIKALEEMEQSCDGCRFFCSKPYYDGICITCARNYSDCYAKEGE